MRTRLFSIVVPMCLMLGMMSTVNAQPKPDAPAKHRKACLTQEQVIEMRTAKMAETLLLDDATAARFSPVYKQYLEELSNCRAECRVDCPAVRDEGDTCKWQKPALTDEEIVAGMENHFAHARQMLDIHEKYYKQLKGILTPKQLRKVFGKCMDGKRPFRHNCPAPMHGRPQHHWGCPFDVR